MIVNLYDVQHKLDWTECQHLRTVKYKTALHTSERVRKCLNCFKKVWTT